MFKSYDNNTSEFANICKKVKTNYWNCKCFFENVEFKNEMLVYDCLNCGYCFNVKFDEILKSKFDQTFKFCDGYLIFKFVLLLYDGAYPYKHMNLVA